jgi:hypothetical protein
MSASAGGSDNPVRRAAAEVAARAPVLVDAYRAARNPAWARAVHRDLTATRRAGAFLRTEWRAPTSGPTRAALVALYRDDIYDCKTGCLFAAALRAEGLETVVAVPNRRQHRMAKYAEALGARRVVFQDTLGPTPAEAEEISGAERALLTGALTFDTVRGWRFRGFDVGGHVLSTLIRTAFDGDPDLTAEVNRRAIERILRETLTNYVRAERLLDDVQPALVLVEEAHYSTNGPLVDVAVAHGIDVIQTIPIWRDDAFMSKRLTAETRRVSPKSVAVETLVALEASGPWTSEHEAALLEDFDRRYGGEWALGAQFQPDTEARSADEICAELDLHDDRPTAVIFAHVLWDASLFYGVDLFANYSDWLVQTVRAAIANDRVTWVVKAHPSNVFRAAHGDTAAQSSEIVLIRDAFPRLPDHVRVLLPETRISTRSLYEFADFGVTVRGTPGLEMPCFGKPVLTAGTGTYAGLGFTVDSATREEYLDRLGRLHEHGPLEPEATQRAKWHAFALFLRRPWVPTAFTSRFDFPERGWHPLDRNVELRATSYADLEADPALAAWARWAARSGDADFLSPAWSTNGRGGRPVWVGSGG